MLRRFNLKLIFFFRTNPWVPISYALIIILLFLIPSSRNKNWGLIHAIVTSSMHLIADIFILLMIDDYDDDKRETGSWFQLIAMIIFTSAKLYSAFIENRFPYLFTDFAFIVSALKNYRIDVLKRKFLINTTEKHVSVCVLCFLFYFFFLLLRNHHSLDIHQLTKIEILRLITSIGLLTFSTGLFINDDKQLSDNISIVGLGLIVMSSGISISCMLLGVTSFSGLDISHFLMPLVVLIYKLKLSLKKDKSISPSI